MNTCVNETNILHRNYKVSQNYAEERAWTNILRFLFEERMDSRFIPAKFMLGVIRIDIFWNETFWFPTILDIVKDILQKLRTKELR